MNNKNMLVEKIETAKKDKMSIAIAFRMPGQKQPEIIINHYSSLDAKKEYYLKAYDDDLYLKTNKDIKMIAVVFLDNDVFIDFQNPVRIFEI